MEKRLQGVVNMQKQHLAQLDDEYSVLMAKRNSTPEKAKEITQEMIVVDAQIQILYNTIQALENILN